MPRGVSVGRFVVIESPKSARERLYRTEIRKMKNSKNYYPLKNRDYMGKYGNAANLQKFLKQFQDQFNQVNRLHGVDERVKREIKRQIHEDLRHYIRPELAKFVKRVVFDNGNIRKNSSPSSTSR